MAQDILSQEEVDALLQGVTGAEGEAAAELEPEAGVRAYDIGRQERIVRGRMPTLELSNERFARLLRVGLFNLLRRSAEVAVGQVRVLKYTDFVRNLVVPTNLNLVQVKPLQGTALIVVEPTLVFQMVDCMFGGSGRLHTRVEGREFSSAEMRVILRLLHVLFREYENAWQPIYPIKLEYLRSEMHTQFANIATPTEIVVATTFAVDLGSGASGLHVCMPYAMLEPIRGILHSGVQADRSDSDNRWLAHLTAQIQDAQVEIAAPLGQAQLRVKDLLMLQPGDILAFELPEAITARVDGLPLLECAYGIANGRYALRVHRLTGSHDGSDAPERSDAAGARRGAQ
jgi:flagellar motor switch protein FliM